MDTRVPRRFGLVIIALALTVAGIAALLTKVSSEDPKLEALRSERIATFAPPRGSLVLDHETEEHRSLGKPTSAQIVRAFAFEDRRAWQAAWRPTLAAARSSGWTLTPPVTRNSPWWGAKAGATARLTLTLAHYRGSDGLLKILIHLEYRDCPSELCKAGA